MGKPDEYEVRHKAIQFYQKGVGFEKILRLVSRSRFWLTKWLRRFKEAGWKGLQDQSRAPKRIWRRTPKSLVQKILALRTELEAHQTRRSAFSGIGPEAIAWALRQGRVQRIPALSTIARILARHGKSGKAKRSNGSQQREPYPTSQATQMGDLHQTDLVGPRHLRGPKGVTRFYSFHTVDVAGHTVATSQFQDKQASSLCRHLVVAWQRLGLPTISQMDNEMAATGGCRYPYSLSQVVRLHLLLGIHLVFIPPGEPGRNATVESFNNLWQERVLRRHPCPTLAALQRMDHRFLHYYHYHKPHRGLTQKGHGTRFPGVLRDRQWAALRQLPQGVDLEDYRDSKGHLHFPLARGKVSFIRKVDPKGYIDVHGASYFIRKKLSGQYIMATVFTHRKKLVIKQTARNIKSFPFPHKESLVAPLVPMQRGKP